MYDIIYTHIGLQRREHRLARPALAEQVVALLRRGVYGCNNSMRY